MILLFIPNTSANMASLALGDPNVSSEMRESLREADGSLLLWVITLARGFKLLIFICSHSVLGSKPFKAVCLSEEVSD